ncbi:unnamed protein product [Leuciscus chuanchicus]
MMVSQRCNTSPFVVDVGSENRPASLKQMSFYTIIIIISCSGVIMVFLIISFSVCIHRKLRQKISSGSHEEDYC